MAKDRERMEPIEAGDAPLDATMTDRDLLLRLTGALEGLQQRMAAPAVPAEMERFERLIATISGAMERVSQSSLAGAKLIADETRQAHRPSNMVVPNISVFNRRGEKLDDYTKPTLKCTMMIPWLVENESCTREEVELLNLLQPGEYLVKRNDSTKVPFTVTIDYKADMVTPSRLVMNNETAFNNDNFRMVPSLVDLLRQILRQHSKEIAKAANDILSDEEECALIEAGELSVSV